MNAPYRVLAAVALVVFAVSQIVVLIELLHDGESGAIFFLVPFAVIAVVVAGLLTSVNRAWTAIVGLVVGVATFLMDVPYIWHIAEFGRAWEFVPITLALCGSGFGAAFAAADLVQRRRGAALDAPPAVAAGFAGVLAVVAVLVVMSFAVDASRADDVSASDRQGATVVTMEDYDFRPDGLELSAGKPARIVLENEDFGTHTFTIKGTDVDVEVAGGDEELIEFTIGSPGEYQLRCDIMGHEGMKGTVFVR